MSKHYLFTFLLASLCIAGMAQRNEPNVLMDVNGRAWNINNPEARISGTAWLAMDWGEGYVLLLNGKRADSMMMNFDLEYQRPMYTYAGVVYEFTDSVQECRFTYMDNGVKKTAFFKSGYPAQDRHKESTLYQVLAEGPRYELVQYAEKTPEQRREFNGPMKIHYDLRSELYIYDSEAKTMRKIKNKKSSIVQVLAGKEQTIERLCREYNLDLRSNDQIALLISKLQ